MKPLVTRLTRRFDLTHSIIQAPMAFAAGGRLAAAVARAGGLGLIGGAYGDQDWIARQFEAAGNQPVGCGFITWAMDDDADTLRQVLDRQPKAVFLSFGDPMPFSGLIRDAGVPLIVQVQTLDHARRAVECGADVVVAQGAEAGGHGRSRATMTLVPEVADMLASRSPDTLLCAAGGIADGRGLAAALMLGADGVVVGSRFWASHEADVHDAMLAAAIAADGDATIRSSVMDIARRLNWPDAYTARVLKNDFTDRWHDDLDGLLQLQDEEAERWREAWQEGDTRTANTFVGEATGLIRSVESAKDILESMSRQAQDCLSHSYD